MKRWSVRIKTGEGTEEGREDYVGVSPQRSAALCESAAAAPGVSSPLASLLLPSRLPSLPAPLPLLLPHHQVSSVGGHAGPR